MENLEPWVQAAANALINADAILIGAGAGMSVDSGLPDYRGKGGLYAGKTMIAGKEVNGLDMSRPAAFRNDPAIAWAYFKGVLQSFRERHPHEGYQILKNWIDQWQKNYFIVTSNIDGYFQRAGFPAEKIRELHGAWKNVQCLTPCTDVVWTLPDDFNEKTTTPSCPNCGGTARPNWYFFAEENWIAAPYQNQKNVYQQFVESLKGLKIVVLEIGAGGAVPTIRMKSRELVKKFDAQVVRINPSEINPNKNTIILPTGALNGLKMLNSAFGF